MLAMSKFLKISLFLGEVVQMHKTGSKILLLLWNHFQDVKDAIFMLAFILIINAMRKK